MPGDPGVGACSRASAASSSPRRCDALRETRSASPTRRSTRSTSPTWGTCSAGDLGISVAYFPSPVSEVIGTGLVWTLLPGRRRRSSSASRSARCSACVAAWGAAAGSTRWLPPALVFLGAFPYFWLAMVLLYVLRLHARLVPAAATPTATTSRRRFSARVHRRASLRHAVLPAATIVLATLGGWMLAMRNTMIARARRGLRAPGPRQGPAAARRSCSATPRATRCCPTSPASAWRSASCSAARCSPRSSSPTRARATCWSRRCATRTTRSCRASS